MSKKNTIRHEPQLGLEALGSQGRKGKGGARMHTRMFSDSDVFGKNAVTGRLRHVDVCRGQRRLDASQN